MHDCEKTISGQKFLNPSIVYSLDEAPEKGKKARKRLLPRSVQNFVSTLNCRKKQTLKLHRKLHIADKT